MNMSSKQLTSEPKQTKPPVNPTANKTGRQVTNQLIIHPPTLTNITNTLRNRGCCIKRCVFENTGNTLAHVRNRAGKHGTGCLNVNINLSVNVILKQYKL